MPKLSSKFSLIIGAFLISIALDTSVINAQPQPQSAEEYLEHRFSIQNPVQFCDFGSSQKARFGWLNIRESSFWHY